MLTFGCVISTELSTFPLEIGCKLALIAALEDLEALKIFPFLCSSVVLAISTSPCRIKDAADFDETPGIRFRTLTEMLSGCFFGALKMKKQMKKKSYIKLNQI